MSYPLPMTRTEAYLAYKAGVVSRDDLKPSLQNPRNQLEAWLAYWTGLVDTYPTKNGDPLMITDEEACLAYLSLVTDTYPEVLKDPRNPRMVQFLKHCISGGNKIPKLILNREELYLSLIKPPTVSNPTPSTNISLEGVADGSLIGLEMYGGSSQNSYTGKNLQYIGPSITNNGITYTHNPDGSVTLNGTTTGNSYFNLNNTTGKRLTLEQGKTYTLSAGGEDLPSGVAVKTRGVEDTGFQIPLSIEADTLSDTTTMANDYETWTYIAVYGTGVTVENLTLYPQIEEGSTATAFEPYVGGAPAPSPAYPQPVVSVSGEQTITIEGQDDTRTSVINLGEIELRKIGNKSDYIYKKDGVWTIHREIDRVHITSDGDWIINAASGATSSDTFTKQNCLNASTDYGDGLCTHFVNKKAYPSSAGTFGIRGGGKSFCFNYGSLVNLDQIKSWVDDNDVYVYYPLATAVDEELEDQNVIDQINDFMETGTPEGNITIVVTANGGLASPLIVEAPENV